MKNTELYYQYRDGDNYKFGGAVVFSGEITEELRAILWASLNEGQDFVAAAIGVPTLFPWETGDFKYDDQSDHFWHEMCDVEVSESTPTDPRSIEDFVKEVHAISAANGWDDHVVKATMDWEKEVTLDPDRLMRCMA